MITWFGSTAVDGDALIAIISEAVTTVAVALLDATVVDPNVAFATA